MSKIASSANISLIIPGAGAALASTSKVLPGLGSLGYELNDLESVLTDWSYRQKKW